MDFAGFFANISRLRALFLGALVALAIGWGAPQACGEVPDADAAFAQAGKEFKASRWPQALDAYADFLATFPDDPRAPTAAFQAGEACMQQRKYVEARAWYTAALERQPAADQAGRIQFRQAEAAYLASDWTVAKSELSRFLEQHPDHALNAYALFYLGQTELRQGQFERARDVFTRGLREHQQGPTATQMRLGLGQAYQRLGQHSSALRYFEYVAQSGDALAADAQVSIGAVRFQMGQYDAAAQTLSPLVESMVKSAASAQAAYWLAQVQLARQQPRDAAATAELAIEYDTNGDMLVLLHYIAGEAWRAAVDRPAAMQHFSALWQEFPDSDWADDALFHHVKLAFEVRDYDLVDRLAVAFQRDYPASPLARGVLQYQCRALLSEQRYEEAQGASEELLARLGDRKSNKITADAVLRGQPTDVAIARYCLGAAFAGLGQHQAALGMLQAVDAPLLPPDLSHEYQLSRTQALQGLGRHGEAVSVLRQHLRAHPPGPEGAACRSRMILALAEAGQWREALAEHAAFREAEKENGEVPQTALRLAEKAYFAGQWQLAATVYEQLIQHKDHANIVAQATGGLAWTKLAADPTRVKDATFEQLLEKYPDNPLAPQAIMLRARSLETAGKKQQAVHLYEGLVQRYARTSQAPEALLAAARLCADLGSPRDAVELLQRLTVEYPRFPQMDAVVYLWAWALIDLDNGAAGQQLLRRLVDEFPRSRYWADSAHQLAEAAAEQKDYATARTLLDRLIASDVAPELRVQTLLLRGQVAAWEQQWPVVTRCMQQVIAQQAEQDSRMVAEYWLAEADYRQGNFAVAAKRLVRLNSDVTNKDASLRRLVALRYGQTLAQLKRWDEALEIAQTLDREEQAFPERPELLLLLGRCQFQQDKFVEARRLFTQAIELGGEMAGETVAMAQWLVGETWYREQKYLEAITAYLDGYQKHDQPKWQAACLLQAGKCYELLDEWQKACDAYGAVVEEYAQTPYVAEARRRLSAAEERSAQVPAEKKEAR